MALNHGLTCGLQSVEILTMLVDELCDEAAFEVFFVAARKGVTVLDPPDAPLRDITDSIGSKSLTMDVFGNNPAGLVPESFLCPSCGRLTSGARYAQHLVRCAQRSARTRAQPSYAPYVPSTFCCSVFVLLRENWTV
jgi:hypothetical protein